MSVHVIVIIDGAESPRRRLPLAEIEAALVEGDELTVCDKRLTEVRLIDKRPASPNALWLYPWLNPNRGPA
jgi:hypothetical protein